MDSRLIRVTLIDLRRDARGQILLADLRNYMLIPFDLEGPRWQGNTCAEGCISRGQSRPHPKGGRGPNVPKCFVSQTLTDT